MNSRALVAEFLGTFALLFIGVGSIAGGAMVPGGGLVVPALAHGLAIACMASAVGHVSGGHFNPAVTLALVATGRFKAADSVGYIIAQIAGAIAGTALVGYCVGTSSISSIQHGIPALGSGITMGQGFVAEVVLTFFLMFVIMGTATDSKAPKMGALFIGLTVTLDIFMGGPICGASMNPARYLGPSVVSGNFANIALYIIAPILGAALAALVYDKAVRGEEAQS
ncbi:MAG: aquaporin [Armatimonadetes bacterium]|nr:aquaporin [Armatimonadota bacterium]